MQKVWEQTICDGDEFAGRGIALEFYVRCDILLVIIG